jgi:hypothetical protein
MLNIGVQQYLIEDAGGSPRQGLGNGRRRGVLLSSSGSRVHYRISGWRIVDKQVDKIKEAAISNKIRYRRVRCCCRRSVLLKKIQNGLQVIVLRILPSSYNDSVHDDGFA